MILNRKEEEVKRFMFEVFIPSLHDMISTINPVEYEKWCGNTCRQTAIFGAYLLKNAFLEEYEWEVWDGMFEGPHEVEIVQWNHAWIYGKCGDRRLFLDLSNVVKERLFIATSNNRYPKEHPDYCNIKELDRTKLEWETMFFNDQEFYTGFRGKQFVHALAKFMDKTIKEKGLEQC